jgi:ubiquinone/menaquinone biosynthesis C-methylase UbiE
MGVDQSYKLHEENSWDSNGKRDTEENIKLWKRRDTVDYWCHQRKFDKMLPLINNDKSAKWLTVGDGRYCSDARYFQEQGVDVLSTDLSTGIALKAQQDGYINQFEKVNAEKMQFADDSFDYAFCKGSYHHFPRPMVALAEMLRVTKKAVCLIEPQDQHIFTRSRIKKFPAKDLLYRAFVNYVRVTFLKKEPIAVIGEIGMPDLKPEYEPIGNFVYEISRPELKKVCYGQNFDAIAFMDINEHYIFGGESEVAEDNSEIFRKLKAELKTMDERCEKGIQNYNYLIAILFKKMPTEKTIADMIKIGFEVEKLTKNPHWK